MRIFFMMSLVLTVSINVLCSEKQIFATTDDEAICSPVSGDGVPAPTE